MSRSDRIEGVDVARGLASLIMIQGHAYDGWVAPEHKESAAYLFTRLLGTLPLPAFLVLAGAAIVLRVDAAARRGERAGEVRLSVLKRGLFVLACGYAVSFAYALVDGGSLETLLRADVLHVIGLSIAAFALAAIGGRRAPDARRLAAGALALAVVPTVLCPWLSPLGAKVGGPLRFAVALFVDVPGVTAMPFVPLVSWLAIGALAAMAMLRARSRSREPSRAGAPASFLVVLALGALAVAIASSRATDLLVAELGGALTRAHPAVWLNVVDLAARGLIVLAVGALASLRLPERARRVLVRLGQGSLVAYVFHIPFCYGRPGAPIRGRLDMTSATLLVVLLMGLSWLAVYVRDALRERRRPARAAVAGSSR
ncbi:MAG TPA: heparan-alpha-glucosaminide N-acetyltransferase domain-containing protein [Sandaracinaceae bacterium]